MLINLRNALMASKRLPYDAEVEFLAADVGGQRLATPYIDTGVHLTGWSSVAIGYQEYDTTQYYPGIFSSRTTPVDHNTSYTLLGYDRLDCGYGSTASWTRNTNVRHLMLQNSSGTLTVTLDDSVVKTVNINNFTSAETTILFADRQNTGLKGAIYYFRIWDENGTLVFDAIPVRKGTVGYLYDRVSKRLFGNAGTGAFSYGSDVVPVEYLRGDGSSAIETDIQWQLKAAYTEVDFRMPDARDSVNKRLLGSSAASFNYITARRTARADYFGFNAATDPLLELVSGTQYKGAAWYENDLYNFSLNDSVATYSTTVHGAAGSFCVFDVTRSSYEDTCFKGDISAVRVYADKTKAQLLNNLQAVRVGQEGAMMDVLTRRIYRNAGTGAFTYGNDLKYPIPAE